MRKFIRSLSTIFILAFNSISYAQQYNEQSFYKVDSLAQNAKPAEALALVNKIYNYSNQHKNATLSVKAAIYKMIFQSYLQENAIDTIVKNLRNDIAIAQQPQKSILQSILATTYWNYYQQNQYRISERTEVLNNTNDDIRTWSLAQLNQEISKNFFLSIKETELLQKVAVENVKPLIEGNANSRLYRPTLYDILANRAIAVFITPRYGLANLPEDNNALNDLLVDYDNFINATLPNDSASVSLKALKIFQELAVFHKNDKNLDALADLELKRLKFIYEKTVDKQHLKFFNNLEHLSEQIKNSEIYSEVLYEQALLHKNKLLPTDTNQLNLAKAIAIAEKAVNAFPKSIGAQNANNLILQIKSKELSFTVKNPALTNKALPIQFTYKNVDTVTMSIYKLVLDIERYRYYKDENEYRAYVKDKTPLKTWKIILPKKGDYQSHTYIDKIDGLPSGDYLVTALSETALGTGSLGRYIALSVSDLLAHSRKRDDYLEYKVVNALDGSPVKNAKIQEAKYTSSFDADLKKTQTNQDGIALTKPYGDSQYALITHQKDSLLINIDAYFPKKVDNNKKLILFTDRAIYRPGQTIYFKGILFALDEEKNTILPNEKVGLSFEDVNGKKIKNTELTTNEFGSLQGSFVIPMGKLNGSMSIKTDYGRISVQVEEYKRPTFEVTFDKSDQKYKLNDSVKVKGRAISFTGYAISNSNLSYKVMRRSMPKFDNYRYRPVQVKQIATGNLTTDGNGNFEIAFYAESDEVNMNYTFDVQVTVTSNNGETKQATKSIIVGKKDILINSQLPQQLLLDKNRDTISYQITNLNNEPIKATVKTEWLLLKSTDRLVNNLFNAENFSLSRADFIKIFPNDEYGGENDINKWANAKTVLTKTITAGKNGFADFQVSEKDLEPGYYKIKTVVIDEQKDTLNHIEIIRIYHNEPSRILLPTEWLVAQKTKIAPNEKAIFRLAGLSEKSKVFYEVYYQNKIEKQAWLNVTAQQSIVEIAALPRYKDGFSVQFFMVNNGVVYSANQQVWIDNPKEQLDIKFLSFRDKLQPGEKEKWKLKISNKAGEKEMAEMVATLYDASLDDLRELNWTNYISNQYNYQKYNWSNMTGTTISSLGLWYNNSYNYYGTIKRQYEGLTLFGFDYYGGYNYVYKNYINLLNATKQKEEKLTKLSKGGLVYGIVLGSDKLAIPGALVKTATKSVSADKDGIYAIEAKQGEIITFSYVGYQNKIITAGRAKRTDVTMFSDNNTLNEVVVTAAGQSMRKESVTGSTVTLTELPLKDQLVRSVRTSAKEAVVIEDNTVYSFVSMENYDPKTGMYMINGKPVFTKSKITPRTNFKELAFFYPQLKTNKEGEIDVEFTIPQSLTKYKMMGFAHTKDLKTANITNQLVTQKQLAISVNAPRFFREGDTIWLSASVNNLSGKALKGQSLLELKDALTGKIIQLSKTPIVQPLDIANGGNQTVKWQLAIPSQINAITYKVIAEAGKHTDGEEMTVPVLTNSILVTESLPMSVRGNTNKTFEMEKLLKSGSSNTLRTQSLTLEYTSNPAWYAVQALPYLMEYPYECAEQTFSRFYANSFATGILNSSPQIKNIFEQWQQAKNGDALLSSLEKNQELKNILLEETPWVRNAENETERKKRIATLFDLNRMTYELKDNFEKLRKMQLASGAFPWFTGMREDRYITQHIVLGIGQLQKAKLIDEKTYPSFKILTNKAIVYLDQQLVKDYNDEIKSNGFSRLPLHYLFARSYFNHQNTDQAFNKALNYYLAKTASSWMTLDNYQQAQAALILIRNKNKSEALKIIGLLKQTAQQKEELGMYWPNNTNGWWWYQSPIETQALLIEAFDEVANDQKSVEEMKIWLLKNKQTNDWKTTKATVAACYALLMKGYNLLADNQPSEIKIGGQDLQSFNIPNNNAEAGTGYQKITIKGSDVKPEMGKVEIKNNNASISWGALYWQYFENLDRVTPSNTGVKIKKQLFLQKNTDKGDVLTAISSSNALKVGDLVKVRIEIYADRAMEYLHLKDMRSAGFEPTNVISQYKYQDGLSYYESTKDAATNFFINYMPKGTYVFEYPLRVTHSGNFSNGITSLQSMYAPEFTTYSEGIRTMVKSLER
ncbi:alpha-2-macroglobulin family protein [Pedobacter ureilyticus]|uniref:Alpha-2-macroglobulin family protein n=1 Tax=Pedobacter ureilyticus TaxID=1393051 RepID=A0ABW9J4J0_9SPHI|nr:alpha-2-macroglobulin family protein [Pedobacter helvus]